jgi:hypothetical protein
MSRMREIAERQARIAERKGPRATAASRPATPDTAGPWRWGVLRSVDLVTRVMMAHELKNKYNPPVEGEDYAVGEAFRVFPMPLAKLEQYNVPGVVMPLAVPLEEEDLKSRGVPILIGPGNRCMIANKMPGGITVVTAAQGSEGGGV